MTDGRKEHGEKEGDKEELRGNEAGLRGGWSGNGLGLDQRPPSSKQALRLLESYTEMEGAAWHAIRTPQPCMNSMKWGHSREAERLEAHWEADRAAD